METTRLIENGETVLKVAGCLDTASTPRFGEAIEALAKETKILVLDFANLEFIASSALRQLVTLEKRLKGEGGEIILKNMNDVVRDVFAMTGLDEVFTLR